MRTKFALWVLGALLFGASPVFATGMTLNFGSPTSLNGDTAVYTYDSHTFTATGFECVTDSLTSCSATGASLVTMNNGPGETGLGVMGSNHDSQIRANQFIQLDFSQLASAGQITLTFQIQSVQTNEGFRLFASNASGLPGTTPLLSEFANGSNNPSNTMTATVNVNFAKDQYIDISAQSGVGNGKGNGVLLGAASVQGAGSASGGGHSPSPAPEPGTLALFGTGLLGLGCVIRKYSSRSA